MEACSNVQRYGFQLFPIYFQIAEVSQSARARMFLDAFHLYLNHAFHLDLNHDFSRESTDFLRCN